MRVPLKYSSNCSSWLFEGEELSLFFVYTSLFIDQKNYPKIRNDLVELNLLLESVNSLNLAKDDLLYVLSSSSTVNDDIVINACKKWKYDFCENILVETEQIPFPMKDSNSFVKIAPESCWTFY